MRFVLVCSQQKHHYTWPGNHYYYSGMFLLDKKEFTEYTIGRAHTVAITGTIAVY